LVTVKETRWKTAFLEMLWFLRGEDHTDYLHEHNCKLWDAWADDKGWVQRIYGIQWRKWYKYDIDGCVEIDQVKNLIEGLKTNPNGRRHIVSAWNVGELDEMALPPCHYVHQCYTSEGYLDLKLIMRSSDFALGLPFNIAAYAMLTHLYARATGLKPRKLIVDLGDCHIYTNHVEQMKEVLERPLIEDDHYNPTRLVIATENTDIDGYKPSDFLVVNYKHHPFVPLPVAV
jgi:thymidylate synthase